MLRERRRNEDRIAERFREFHEANPHVYARLEQLCADWVAKNGVSKVGIAMFVEVLRWEHGMKTRDPDPDAYGHFKINNDYRALYARRLLRAHPEWEGLLETRSRRRSH